MPRISWHRHKVPKPAAEQRSQKAAIRTASTLWPAMNPLDSHFRAASGCSRIYCWQRPTKPCACPFIRSAHPTLFPVGRKVSGPADFAHRPGLSTARKQFMQPRRSKRTIFYILLCCFRNSLHDAARFL